MADQQPRPEIDDIGDEAFLTAVQEGIEDADAGRTVPYDEIRRWVLSWGSEGELPPPSEP